MLIVLEWTLEGRRRREMFEWITDKYKEAYWHESEGPKGSSVTFYKTAEALDGRLRERLAETKSAVHRTVNKYDSWAEYGKERESEIRMERSRRLETLPAWHKEEWF